MIVIMNLNDMQQYKEPHTPRVLHNKAGYEWSDHTHAHTQDSATELFDMLLSN